MDNTTTDTETTNNGGTVDDSVKILDSGVPEKELAKEVEEEVEPEAKRPRFGLKHVTRAAEQFEWELPEELFEYFQTYVRTHVADEDMRAEMEEYPPPSNAVNIVPILDPFMVHN